MTIQIGKHTVGPGEKPFIVAEVGSNWSNLDDCMTSIHLAKACGADAVKFQAYDAKALYGRYDYRQILASDYKILSQAEAEQKHSEVELRRTIPGQLPLDWLSKLKAQADACGIEFMCTAFSPELAEVVNPFVNVHKVASAELAHVRLLQKLRSFGKPVILSTGASGEADIRMALHVLTSCDADPLLPANPVKPVPVILMYCVAAYPAQEIKLGTIELLRNHFNLLVGYSDHSTDVHEIPVMAVRGHGACVLEKHFTAITADTPDRPVSLGVDQFKRMVHSIHHGVEPVLASTHEETPMVVRHNRRLLATRDINLGEPLTEGVNFGIYRSLKDDTKAASPWSITQMNGKPVKRAIPAGDGISYGDV